MSGPGRRCENISLDDALQARALINLAFANPCAPSVCTVVVQCADLALAGVGRQRSVKILLLVLRHKEAWKGEDVLASESA